jgi:hypothetical protein
MTKSSCESSQDDWCFFDPFLLVLFWTLPFDASLASWCLGFLVLSLPASWYLGIYLNTICRSASSLININSIIVKVSNEVPP